MILRKKSIFLSLLFLLGTFVSGSTHAFVAICDLCTVAVVAGVGFSRYLGIDDLITSLWIGALILVVVGMTLKILDKYKINFRGRDVITTVLFFLITYAPLYIFKIVGVKGNTLLGVDKVIFGSIVGAVILWGMLAWYSVLKRRNNHHAYFPFQKVVMPTVALTIVSFIFYFLTR